MHRRSQGFSLLEIILTIAVIVLIGTVGWMFINNQKTDSTKVDSSSDTFDTKAKTQQSSKNTNKSANWLTWQPENKQYSIKLADGWNVYLKQGAEASFYVTDGIELKPGIKAKVHTTSHEIAPCDNAVLNYMNYTYPSEWYTGEEETFKTNSGLNVKKTIVLPSDGSQGIPSTDTSYHYVISTTDKSVVISYTKCENSTDYHDLFEEVVKTFKF